MDSDYRKIAINYINENAGDKYAIIESSINDLHDFYCFTYQSKQYLNTGNYDYFAVGQGYIFISKKDQRIFPYGSRFSFEESIENLRDSLSKESFILQNGFKYHLGEKHTLLIKDIHNKEILLNLLIEHELEYIIPEVDGESIYRIAKRYKRKDLEQKLNNLPFKFSNISEELNLFYCLIINECCNFSIEKKIKTKFQSYTNKATDIDLKPVW